MKITQYLATVLVAAQLLFTGTALAQNNTLAQLGVNGVTAGIPAEALGMPEIYAGFLIKTGPGGILDASLLPASSSTEAVRLNEIVFLDIVSGIDSPTNGTIITPYQSFGYAVSQATNDSTFIFMPGTYTNSTTTITNMGSLTLIGFDPDRTTLEGTIRFTAAEATTVKVSNMTVTDIRRQDYELLDVHLYDHAVLTGNIYRQYATDPSTYLTVYHDPSVTIDNALTTSNALEVLTHDAAYVAYTPSDTNAWWLTEGAVPINIQSALDQLAGRVVAGTTVGELLWWDGDTWEALAKGSAVEVLWGGSAPSFRSPTWWGLSTNAIISLGTADGQLMYWNTSSNAWAHVAAGTTNQVLYGGPVPAFATERDPGAILPDGSRDFTADQSMGNFSLTGVNILKFTLTNDPPVFTAIGDVVWDSEHGVPAVWLSENVLAQWGDDVPRYCRNTSGATILEGNVVRVVAGGTGHNPDIALSIGTSEATAKMYGVATEDILDNGWGWVSAGGSVHGLATAWGTEGQALYLSTQAVDSVTGYNISTNRQNNGLSPFVGYIQNAHGSQGIIEYRPEPVVTIDAVYGAAEAFADHAALTGANDVHEMSNTVVQAASAYGWGDHSTYGYLTAPPVTNINTTTFANAIVMHSDLTLDPQYGPSPPGPEGPSGVLRFMNYDDDVMSLIMSEPGVAIISVDNDLIISSGGIVQIASLSAVTGKIIDVGAGTIGTDAVNKGQMDTADSTHAALTGAEDVHEMSNTVVQAAAFAAETTFAALDVRIADKTLVNEEDDVAFDGTTQLGDSATDIHGINTAPVADQGLTMLYESNMIIDGTVYGMQLTLNKTGTYGVDQDVDIFGSSIIFNDDSDGNFGADSGRYIRYGQYQWTGTTPVDGRVYGTYNLIDNAGPEALKYGFRAQIQGTGEDAYGFYADVSDASVGNYAFYAAAGDSYFKDTEVDGDLTVIGANTANAFIQNETNLYDFITTKAPLHYNTSDGLTEEKHSAFIETDGVNVWFETEVIGGGDLVAIFDSTDHILDCTTGAGVGGRAQIALTPGLDTAPQGNWVHITDGGTAGVLTVTTTRPTGEFAMLAYVLVPTAATVLADEGKVEMQRWTDSVEHDGRGKVAHIAARVRKIGAAYESGITPTVNGDGTVSTTAGQVWQHHLQVFPSFAINTRMLIVNDFTTPYRAITNLNEITHDSAGVAIPNNNWMAVWLGGYVAAGDDGQNELLIWLPSDTYIIAQQAGALSDSSAFDDTVVPIEKETAIFPISRIVMQWNTGPSVSSFTVQDRRRPTLAEKGGGGGASPASINADAVVVVPAGSIVSTDAQAALEEIDGELIDHAALTGAEDVHEMSNTVVQAARTTVTLGTWYNMALQDPSAASKIPWDDGSGNIVYSRVLGSTNSVNLYFDYEVATGAVVRITSPLAWETGTNVTADVICNIKYAYESIIQASVTNTTAALPTLATATRGKETICTWTNTVGTGHYRFWFDKADSDVAYGELGFMGAPTITIIEP